MVMNSTTVYTPAIIAAVRIVQLLPLESRRWELRNLLHLVSNMLKSREYTLRHRARTALVKIAKDLGAPYAALIMEILRASLPLQGLTAHVLSYTVYSVIEGIV